MSRIGIDGTGIKEHGKGISCYQKNLICALSRLETDHEYIIFLNAAERSLDLPRGPQFRYVPVAAHPAIRWEQIELPLQAHRWNLDLIHTTRDRLPFLCPRKFLLYLFEVPDHRIRLIEKNDGHDFYELLSHRYTLSTFRHSLEKASLILTSSGATREELIADYRVLSSKIKVVYPGAEEMFRPEPDPVKINSIRKTIGAADGYVLHFATGDPRENTDLVLEAFRKIERSLRKRMKLVLGGIHPHDRNPFTLELARKVWSDFVILQPYLPRQELVRLYQAATLYVDMSLHEGFGFHVIEAMACGIPVIASNRSSLPELLRDAGCLVDPESADELSQAILAVLKDESLQARMKSRGLARSREFSWLETAKKTVEVYNDLLR